jgi:hypothetical protein
MCTGLQTQITRSSLNTYFLVIEKAYFSSLLSTFNTCLIMQFCLRLIIYSAGRCGRAGRKGLVTAIIAKRDKILSDAIQVQ